MNMIADRLRIARENKNMTQASVAAELNVRPATISRYETGNSDPDTETIRRLAVLYGASTDWLFGLTDDPTPHTTTAAQREQRVAMPADATLTDEQLAARLPEDLRESVMALIRIAHAE